GPILGLSAKSRKILIPGGPILGLSAKSRKILIPGGPILGLSAKPGKFQFSVVQILGAPHNTAGANSKLDKTWGQRQRGWRLSAPIH
ncbi:hypothetical protein, partial [Ochrobactrum soli]|uniref:hypothetical protein n=1 Tax=Ochrobactrum soli TaxID=2448455 RepID=UPI001AED8D88